VAACRLAIVIQLRQRVRETEILVEQQPPQGVFACDHAGLVINKFSEWDLRSLAVLELVLDVCAQHQLLCVLPRGQDAPV